MGSQKGECSRRAISVKTGQVRTSSHFQSRVPVHQASKVNCSWHFSFVKKWKSQPLLSKSKREQSWRSITAQSGERPMEQRYWYGTSSLKRKIYWTSWCSTKEQRFWNNYIKLSSTWWLDQSILSVCTKKYPPSHSIKPFQTCCGVTWGKKVHQEGKYRLVATTVCSNSPASIHLRGSLCICLHIGMKGGLENICPARSGQSEGYITVSQLDS